MPVSGNGSRQLRFVLDSGAGAAAVTNPLIVDSLNLNIAGKRQVTLFGGVVQTKGDILAALKATRDPARPEPKFSTEDVQSRVEDEAVILTGRFVQRIERDGQTRTMEARYNDTYVKRQGRWQVVASHL